MTLKLTIRYKNKKAIISFLIFFFNLAKRLKIYLKIRKSTKKTTKKRISILKSPHVHKTAQEQFEFKVHSKTILLFSTQPLKVMTFLKVMQTKIFPDLNITTTCLSRNFFFLNLKKLKIRKYKRIKTTLKSIEFYGENNLTRY